MKTRHLFLLSTLGGLLMSVAWPEIGSISYLIFIAFIPLLLAEDFIARTNGSTLKLFGLAYWQFFLFNLITTWWIYFASDWGMVMAVVCNSFFMACVFQLYYYTKKHLNAKVGYSAFVILWLGFEYLHLNWDLSWPWLTLGNVFANDTYLVQWYEYTGVFGGSLWILTLNIIGFLVFKKMVIQKLSLKEAMPWVASFDFVFLIPLLVSIVISTTYEEKVNPVNCVILQPNIDPYNEKFGSMSAQEQVAKTLRLAVDKMTDNIDFVIAPETALPNGYWEESLHEYQEVQMVNEFCKMYPETRVIIGLSSLRVYGDDEEIPASARKFTDADKYYGSFNTAIQMSSSDEIQLYRKSKLVLGVEKMPFPFLEKLSIDLGGASGSLGTEKEPINFRSSMENNSGVIAPIICYESIHGEYYAEFVEKGAQAVAIITNDGWWENTPGYKQHLAYARLRAIETRRSIARSANTGISCFINQTGDIIQPTEWWVEDAIVGSINLNDEITFYTKTGDYIGRISAWFAMLLILWAFVRSIKNKSALSKVS